MNASLIVKQVTTQERWIARGRAFKTEAAAQIYADAYDAVARAPEYANAVAAWYAAWDVGGSELGPCPTPETLLVDLADFGEPE